jgi:Flp pilus assembly protein TadG
MRASLRSHGRRDTGQALVEFSLAITVFLMLLLGVFDLGRGIYTYNGLAEGARDIARITSVHLGSPVGSSVATTNRVAVQKGLTPGLSNPTFACVDLYGAASSCSTGNYVTVAVNASYSPISLLGIGGPITLTSSSSVQIP